MHKEFEIDAWDNYDGVLEENSVSIRRRIAATFGFNVHETEMMECSYVETDVLGPTVLVADTAAFRICGIGYSTDFKNIARAEAYDIRRTE